MVFSLKSKNMDKHMDGANYYVCIVVRTRSAFVWNQCSES